MVLLRFGVQNPVDHEQRALDAADLSYGRSEFVLPRIGGELAQYLAGCDAAGRNGGGDPKNVGPIAFDQSN
ncbi:hypothetical protein PMI09_00946 [Rhizobium sp. CF122]|nr:hypothetical protein PMI09_00946 [Rhizobium sp. CF122]